MLTENYPILSSTHENKYYFELNPDGNYFYLFN